ENNRFELRDISVLFPEGKLSIITGPTASGKTALLMALLGEMTLLPGGRIIMSKNLISYAAQSPWLRHQSIRDNILFGYPYEEARYRQVIECCALQPDLEMLEDGDATEIGARGVNLSGGQKARVALARAVYVRSRFVLLDDPLSAVDSHTARLLFDKLLRGPLLAHRTVILVTHHVDLVLSGANYLVRMLDGRIDAQGTVEDLRSRGLLDEITHDAAADVKAEEPVAAIEANDADPDDPEAKPKKPRKLVKDEHRAIGGVKWAIYKSYLQASSYGIWAFLLFAVLVGQFLNVGEKLWIKTWGSAYGQSNSSMVLHYQSFASLNPEYSMDGHGSYVAQVESRFEASGLFDIKWPSAIEHPLFYVGVYAAIGLTTAFVSLCSVAAQYTGALRASRLLFKQLLVSVVRATFRFHDTTPLGRMLNRFGLDMDKIDSDLAGSLQAVNSSLAGFFASVITITIVFPAFLFPAIVLGFIYYRLALGYLNTGRDLRRMESNSRSPIYSDFGELLEGIVTVRGMYVSLMVRFLDNLHTRVSTATKMWYVFWMTNRWLLLNFDCLGAFAVFVTAVFSIALLDNDAGLAGLAMTSALTFTNAVYWACRQWTALEVDLNSVERVVEYLKLPQEPPAVIESNRPPAYWPSSSRNDSLLRVEDLVVKYSPELPPVLQGINFTLKSGERVGLIGRTGSGKSTLAMSLLRFVDPVGGKIVIDGIDICSIGINDLRSRVTFIPQDATLFSGTLRDNLDPFGDHDDAACMDALHRVHMISDSPAQSRGSSRGQSMATTPCSSRPPSINGSVTDVSLFTDVDAKVSVSLDSQVSAGGTNFSQGQRQLIAMARALLRRSAVVLMDESTSSVDFATDTKIQKAIREEFNDSLLITIAHRLKTVIDYDRLLVLDQGRVVEFDTPYTLIQKEDGVFRGMCLKSGSFRELELAARAKEDAQRQTW
ncbi:P-loop containing nucleoside triphosphate hydrolase protein, partial [Mycena galopus ATCC 62051]